MGNPPKKSTPKSSGSQWIVQDSRFAEVQSDPRFMRPPKKLAKVKVDERFRAMLNPKNKDFDFQQRVDRYGRPIARSRDRVDLRKFYRLDDDKEQDEASFEKQERKSASDDNESHGDSDAESNDEHDVDLGAFARGEVLMESSSDEASDKNEEDASESEEEVEGEFNIGETQENENAPNIDPDEVLDTRNIPIGDETRRFAVVNMDWDNVSAMALLKLFETFKPKQGVIHSVTVYPSEFGKKRLEMEDSQGPALYSDDSQSEEEEETDDILKSGKEEEIDQLKLRKYQLERLRYFFAVVECDSISTARHIYKEVDGTEYEHSSVIMDLRYIPDDVVFDEQPKERVTEVAPGYQPRDFITNALQNSNVKLTWDEDDPDRLKVTKHKFSKEDLQSMDFKAYIASSGSEDEEDPEEIRSKYRSILLGETEGNEDHSEQDEEGQDMEITFAPGLGEMAHKLLEQKKQRETRADETVFEEMQRKKAEKKKAKKLANRQTSDMSDSDMGELNEDDFFKMDGFERKEKTKAKPKKVREDEESIDPALHEIMADIAADETNKKHFDMDEIEKSMKKNKKRLKKKKASQPPPEQRGDEFELNLKDDRFNALFTSEQFAIDTTSSKYKKTGSMEKIVKERQKRQRDDHTDNDRASQPVEDKDISSLVKKIKANSSKTSRSI